MKVNLREIERDVDDALFGWCGCVGGVDTKMKPAHESSCLASRVLALVQLVREARDIMFHVRGIEKPPREDAWLAKAIDDDFRL